MTETRDFTRARKPLQFRIDGDLFTAAPTLASENLLVFANRYSTLVASKGEAQVQYDAMNDLLNMSLHPESYARFHARLTSVTDPIDLEQMAEVVVWLVEVYGLRPTMPPSDSVSGSASPDDGTPLTESTPDAASTSSPSPQTVS